MEVQEKTIKNPVARIYAMGFLLVLHYVLPIYITSSFLAEFVSEKTVGLLYALAACVTILAFLMEPSIIRKVGVYPSAIIITFLEIFALVGLALSSLLIFVIPFFIAHFVLIALIGYQTDILLETFSTNERTGSIRGMYLTFINIAWFIGPTIAGFVLAGEHYGRVFALGALILIPFLILLRSFSGFKDVSYTHRSIGEEIRAVYANMDMRGIILTNLFLQIFFAAMVVYTPIYLHEVIGFGFETIGVLFTLMLSAYLLTELPLGKLADTKLGEKEILIGGFCMLVISTALLSFLSTKDAFLWGIVLFGTRVGAAAVESMTETYFFKHIDATNINDLALYRMNVPLSYLIAPLLASGFLLFFDFKYIFLAIAFFMLVSLVFVSQLHDTK